MAQIQKGTTYTTGDQVTAANLNALADAAILLPGAITDQTAKTVPLAADTVLIHSAADTALRKSTLTQLFANATGIPISTGISGLGTGIATALAINTGSAGAPVLFNGALGTPSSGTVTNLTGTASININGTVGATTPSTVAATTITATGSMLANRSNGLNIPVIGVYGNDYGLGMDSSDLVAFFNSGGGFSIKTMTVGGTTVGRFTSTGLAVTGALSCTGALSKGSGSFRIEHPLPEKSATHQLVHSFIEGPQADLIYRGKVVLVDGKASVNIDTAATMTEGTFEVLCRDVQCFTTNETGWTAVRGKVTGNILTIEAKDADCTDEISWMVIGERQDPHMMETDWTDDNGKVIVEPLKPSIESN